MLRLPFALWTRETVGEPITQRTGISLPPTTVGTYLSAWDPIPKRPVRRATARDEAAIQAWMERDYPAILKRASLVRRPVGLLQ